MMESVQRGASWVIAAYLLRRVLARREWKRRETHRLEPNSDQLLRFRILGGCFSLGLAYLVFNKTMTFPHLYSFGVESPVRIVQSIVSDVQTVAGFGWLEFPYREQRNELITFRNADAVRSFMTGILSESLVQRYWFILIPVVSAFGISTVAMASQVLAAKFEAIKSIPDFFKAHYKLIRGCLLSAACTVLIHDAVVLKSQHNIPMTASFSIGALSASAFAVEDLEGDNHRTIKWTRFILPISLAVLSVTSLIKTGVNVTSLLLLAGFWSTSVELQVFPAAGQVLVPLVLLSFVPFASQMQVLEETAVKQTFWTAVTTTSFGLALVPLQYLDAAESSLCTFLGFVFNDLPKQTMRRILVPFGKNVAQFIDRRVLQPIADYVLPFVVRKVNDLGKLAYRCLEVLLRDAPEWILVRVVRPTVSMISFVGRKVNDYALKPAYHVLKYMTNLVITGVRRALELFYRFLRAFGHACKVVAVASYEKAKAVARVTYDVGLWMSRMFFTYIYDPLRNGVLAVNRRVVVRSFNVFKSISMFLWDKTTRLANFVWDVSKRLWSWIYDMVISIVWTLEDLAESVARWVHATFVIPTKREMTRVMELLSYRAPLFVCGALALLVLESPLLDNPSSISWPDILMFWGTEVLFTVSLEIFFSGIEFSAAFSRPIQQREDTYVDAAGNWLLLTVSRMCGQTPEPNPMRRQRSALWTLLNFSIVGSYYVGTFAFKAAKAWGFSSDNGILVWPGFAFSTFIMVSQLRSIGSPNVMDPAQHHLVRALENMLKLLYTSTSLVLLSLGLLVNYRQTVVYMTSSQTPIDMASSSLTGFSLGIKCSCLVASLLFILRMVRRNHWDQHIYWDISEAYRVDIAGAFSCLMGILSLPFPDENFFSSLTGINILLSWFFVSFGLLIIGRRHRRWGWLQKPWWIGNKIRKFVYHCSHPLLALGASGLMMESAFNRIALVQSNTNPIWNTISICGLSLASFQCLSLAVFLFGDYASLPRVSRIGRTMFDFILTLVSGALHTTKTVGHFLKFLGTSLLDLSLRTWQRVIAPVLKSISSGVGYIWANPASSWVASALTIVLLYQLNKKGWDEMAIQHAHRLIEGFRESLPSRVDLSSIAHAGLGFTKMGLSLFSHSLDWLWDLQSGKLLSNSSFAWFLVVASYYIAKNQLHRPGTLSQERNRLIFVPSLTVAYASWFYRSLILSALGIGIAWVGLAIFFADREARQRFQAQEEYERHVDLLRARQTRVAAQRGVNEPVSEHQGPVLASVARRMQAPEQTARQQIIASLPSATTVEKVFRPEECAICLEKVADTDTSSTTLSTLDCGHQFHSGCIASWIQQRPRCPVCREPVHMEMRALQAIF